MIELDVRELPPCEPLERVMAALRDLPPGDYLSVLHRREPFPLYRLLEQGGYAWRTRPRGGDGLEILVWHRGDSRAEAALAPLPR